MVDFLKVLAKANLAEESRTSYTTRLVQLQEMTGGKSIEWILDHPKETYQKIRRAKSRSGQPYNMHSVQAFVMSVTVLFHHVPNLKQKKDKAFAEWQKIAKAVREPVAEHYGQNKPSDRQEKAVEGLHWKDILKARDALPKGSPERLLFMMYTEQRPVRNDYVRCRIYERCPKDTTDGNFIVITPAKKGTFFLNEYKTAKTYKSCEIPLSSKTVEEIKASLKLHPRQYLFVDRYGKPYTRDNSFDRWANGVVQRVLQRPNFTLTIFRHLYLTQGVDIDKMCMKDRQQIATEMCHGLQMQQTYKWL
jgi:integrase